MSCPVPVVTLAHGFAVGGGLGLLSVSDVVIAEENSRFRFSENWLGLVPSIISPFVLRKTGLSQAKFLMLSALPFTAKQAHHIGLTHFVGKQSECSAFLQQILKNFKELDRHAVSETKKWLNSIYHLPLSETKEEGVSIISQSRKRDSARKRITNLLNRSSVKNREE